MGRTPIPIDVELLKKHAAIHCTLKEMASLHNVSESTLTKNYNDIINAARDSGKMSLRRKQIEIALGGNVPMLIWLGKQYLEQKDKIELEELRFRDKHEALERLDEARARLAEAIEAETFKKPEQKDVTPETPTT